LQALTAATSAARAESAQHVQVAAPSPVGLTVRLRHLFTLAVNRAVVVLQSAHKIKSFTVI
jgi:hypothetical protein